MSKEEWEKLNEFLPHLRNLNRSVDDIVASSLDKTNQAKNLVETLRNEAFGIGKNPSSYHVAAAYATL